MEINVLKFGGTATKTKASREKIINIVKELLPEKVIIVASAMGRNGFPYATDTLKELVNEDNITKKELDRLLSVGEIISTIVLCSELNASGVNAYSLSALELGLTSDSNFGDAYVKELDNERIVALFKEYDVLVAPGFIAANENGELTTFKRGGSDLSAVFIGILTNAEKIILYKDVDGIFPMHPPANKLIHPYKHISYSEMLALISTGYHVVQKDALLEAEKHKIQIQIKNYMKRDGGTIISEVANGSKIIGLNSNQNEINIATFHVEELKEKVETLLKNQHIYIKEVIGGENILSFKLSTSQLFLARRLIINNFHLTEDFN